ncbi:YiiX/YebB-like N1pC/P60 family cysteine hydrolase [Chryseobacterium oryctis]|uniref:YiiX/YebB-like N1pC/P60 family cysteine hydrolase n=1 Tax=Chryseobacterium oryctis TaxID=2952618 RepID=A0ABT3HN31_9FLAO|nr:YiiX/YebB-like N1pC/P60 family cysteine hydrolase [Chryseobacterium oryctis]MCW3161110.1 YiiX/YebB-like N1pC/P60 family cysteine hydrolase [Chryseobacterium oryctis]
MLFYKKKYPLILITIMGIALIIVVFSFNHFNSLYERIHHINFDNQTVYLIQRGTTGKLGNIAKDFNIKNKYASHIGIGFIHNNKLSIYHVYVDKNQKNNNLYIESLEEFIQPEDINYLCVWRLQEINPQKFESIKKSLIQSEKENILFDFIFKEDNNNYYCSEFVAKKLEESGVHIMKNNTKPISGIAKQALDRDTLTYFPVDGFENSRQINKIFEWIK